MASTQRGKNTARLALSLLLLALLLSAATPVHSRHHQGLTPSFTGRRGSELGAWRKDVIRPDRTSEQAPPAPTANSNVPGGPSG
nr:unnamed protein product [Digitaria exilis]